MRRTRYSAIKYGHFTPLCDNQPHWQLLFLQPLFGPQQPPNILEESVKCCPWIPYANNSSIRTRANVVAPCTKRAQTSGISVWRHRRASPPSSPTAKEITPTPHISAKIETRQTNRLAHSRAPTAFEIPLARAPIRYTISTQQ